ncbi:Fc receptor-like protein 5 [Carassius auratus]|uniref:Fc receptor-like protein 5 n=1 Tax=Carassius auratus TaxID=7957 RepID=A0A6P6KDP1_CARAU|nr:Fc receptor-like protein 5 [Carassius auratus]XP_026070407.1 Fc receptor-like protein 5 [Carassius auratus]
MELGQLPLVLLLISNIHSGHTEVSRAVLSVSPQKWLTEGDPVTLICEVNSFSTDWTFSWFTLTASDYDNHFQLLSDSSRGAGGNYTVSSAALKHTGVYVCRAEIEKTAYKTTYSNTQPVWITGVSPLVSLIISPNRTQHFTSDSFSLICEDQRNSDRWRVRSYTDHYGMEDCSSDWTSQVHTCTFVSITTSNTGVYWCLSESGENSHPVNITVHYGVILESPVHPVTEGDTLTLRCLYQHSTPPNLRADFYKDGSLIQSQTTEMIISTVSKSHEGFYYCKHSERGESPKSWISVRGVSPQVSLIISPSRTQHFTSVSLSLSCEDQSNSDRWRVRRYTDSGQWEDCSSSLWGSQTGSTCTISSTNTSDTGVYWCQSQSGEKYHPVNITVHSGVILESPVHPVTEGDTLTLRCLYQHSTPPNLRADFYKDGPLIQSQTTEMIISIVSKSHEGFYYCKHSERGESPKSWISVRVSPSESQVSVLHTLSSVLAVCPYLLVTVVLIFKCCRMRVTSLKEEETAI